MRKQMLYIAVIFPAVLFFFIEPGFSQSINENNFELKLNSDGRTGVHFSQALIGMQNVAGDSLAQRGTTTPDSLQKEKSMNIGRIAGFATIGFLSGLFFGASMEQTGNLSGPGFHLEPALIGAGIGVAASFIIPENWGKKKKKRQ